MDALLPVFLIVLTIAVLVAMLVFFSVVRVWMRAAASGVPIRVVRVVGMRLRGNPAQLLVDAHILLSKAGVQSTLDETEYIFMRNRNRIRTAEELVRLVKDGSRRK
jgi:uncharacterized protein YqfA (UPF0365 family)